MKPNNTIAEAKKYLRANFRDGVDCPCCGQLVRLWKHKLNSAIARTLISMYVLHEKEGKEYVHIMREVGITTMYGIAFFWGLIEPKLYSKDDKETDGKKASGYWKLTEKGKQFVQRTIEIEKYVWVYNDHVQERSEETINIEEALGNKFNYIELLEGR